MTPHVPCDILYFIAHAYWVLIDWCLQIRMLRVIYLFCLQDLKLPKPIREFLADARQFAPDVAV